MKTITFLISIILLTTLTHAQDMETDQSNKTEVSKLAFIVDDWKGNGWMMGQDGQKHSFDQTESISFKLDSTAILVQGLGKANGKVIHNAMAIITYNKADNNYNFHSYLANGREEKFKAELKEKELHWYPMDNMRYIIFINEKGQWCEKGEMKRGEQWFQFFEMTLDKQ